MAADPRPRALTMPGFLEQMEPDLFRGLAVEEWLLDHAKPPCLFLWRSPEAVVLGKNQNPWLEVNLGWIEQERVALARRCSGGGAVYHDPGNLNIAWVLDRPTHQPLRQQEWLRDVLADLGVRAQVVASGALFVGKAKISGVAYCHRRDRVLHHATLLVEADLGRLRAALAVPRIRLKTHAVASVPAQVTNLNEVQPGLDVARVARALRDRALTSRGGWTISQAPTTEQLEGYLARHRDPAWRWDQTPMFEICLEHRGRTITLEIRRGVVARLRVAGEDFGPVPLLPFRDSLPHDLAALLGGTAVEFRAALESSGFSRLPG